MLIIVAENKPFQFSIASPKLSDTNTTVFSVTYQYERNWWLKQLKHLADLNYRWSIMQSLPEGSGRPGPEESHHRSKWVYRKGR